MTLREKIAKHIPPDKQYVSNSSLSTVKKILLGQAMFWGDEKFLHFGREVHRRILEPQEKQEHTFSGEDERTLEIMCENALSHPQLLADHRVTQKEEIMFGRINGLMFKIILDMSNLIIKFGSDLKSTSTTTEKAFIASAKKYDYFRQAWIYMQVAGLESFRFYALQKKEPWDVFVLDVADYPEEMESAANETKILIDIIKTNTDITKYKTMKNPTTNKDKVINFRLHEKLFDALEQRAFDKLENVSEYVRGLVKADLERGQS